MIVKATKQGLLAAGSNPKLIATFWAINLTLAAATALPVWLALSNAMGSLPLTDSLQHELSFGILADLGELWPGLTDGLRYGAVAVLLLGVLAGLAVTGGALEVLTRTEGSFPERFGRGAFGYYGRFFRLGITTLIVGGILTAAVTVPLGMLTRHLRREAGSEMQMLAALAASVAAGLLMVLMALLAQDAARVMLVRGDVKSAVRGFLRGLATVWRHPFRWLGAWLVNAALLALALAGYLALADALGESVWLGLAFVVQQLFVIVRCALRVAFLGTSMTLVPAPAAVAHAEPIQETVIEQDGYSIEPATVGPGDTTAWT